MERRRETIALGELVKLNLRRCECGKVWVPEMQASKARGIEPGWYDDIASVRRAFESDRTIDPVIRISSSPRGSISCPHCS